MGCVQSKTIKKFFNPFPSRGVHTERTNANKNISNNNPFSGNNHDKKIDVKLNADIKENPDSHDMENVHTDAFRLLSMPEIKFVESARESTNDKHNKIENNLSQQNQFNEDYNAKAYNNRDSEKYNISTLVKSGLQNHSQDYYNEHFVDLVHKHDFDRKAATEKSMGHPVNIGDDYYEYDPSIKFLTKIQELDEEDSYEYLEDERSNRGVQTDEDHDNEHYDLIDFLDYDSSEEDSYRSDFMGNF